MELIKVADYAGPQDVKRFPREIFAIEVVVPLGPYGLSCCSFCVDML